MKPGSKAKKSQADPGPFCHTRFGDYSGKNRYEVRHAAHLPVIVAAPDETAAIVAAADYCGQRWTDYSYYAYAEVTKALKEEKKK